MLRFSVSVASVALLMGGLGLPGRAVTISGHTPPHLLKQGRTSKPTTSGSVMVQVLVSANGSASVKRILKSTNHADDAAALEVARSSTYAPAVNDGKPNTEFYDFFVKFNGSGVAAAPPASAGSLASYEAMTRAGKYADAKAGLTTYLGSHAADPKAQLDLALVDTFTNDLPEAAAAFAKVDAIPENMKGAARKAFYETAVGDVQAKKYDEALVYAKKSVAISPDYISYAALGEASSGSGDAQGAVTAYEKSRSLASSASAKERSAIDLNLASAYLAANEPEKAKSTADEAKGLDPSANAGGAFGQYYSQLASSKETAGDLPGAAATYEAGAAADPKDAVTLYTEAAFAYLKMKTVDNAKATADAGKALALDPTDAGANFAAGIALANTGHTPEAIASLNKADAAAKAKGQTSLQTQIETNLQRLSPPK